MYKQDKAASFRNNAEKKNLESRRNSEPPKVTNNENLLLYFDSFKLDSRVLFFAKLPALDLHSLSDICPSDESFSVAPDVFYQVYTIHRVIENTPILLVYALLPNKTQET